MDECVLLSVLVFDDETYSAKPLQFGTREVCERVADHIPAVSYSGGGNVTQSFLRVIAVHDWKILQADVGGVDPETAPASADKTSAEANK